MSEKIKKYKDLTLKMISIIGVENDFQDKIAVLLDERQTLLDTLSSNEELIEFRVLYKEYDIVSLDNTLRNLLSKELNQAKTDVLNQQKKKAANFAYSKVNREGLNLFSTQI